MAVQVQGDARFGVAQSAADDENRHPLIEHQRCCRMPEIVEADLWEPGGFEQRFEVAVEKIPGVERSADGVGEDQAMLMPPVAHQPALELLVLVVCPQHFNRLPALGSTLNREPPF